VSAAKGILASFAAGGLFGAGLLVSQMTNPTKIIEFLDLFRDPSLALVMIGALVTTYIGYRIVLKRPSPIMGLVLAGVYPVFARDRLWHRYLLQD